MIYLKNEIKKDPYHIRVFGDKRNKKTIGVSFRLCGLEICYLEQNYGTEAEVIREALLRGFQKVYELNRIAQTNPLPI